MNFVQFLNQQPAPLPQFAKRARSWHWKNNILLYKSRQVVKEEEDQVEER